MIALIKGILIEVQPSYVVVEVSGIGYKVFVPSNYAGSLPELGKSLILHTSFVIRENSQSLYGFYQQVERSLFEILMEINGIGPKLALSVISHITVEDLHAAIARNDLRTLTKIPGIGKKTAERLAMELRDKLNQFLGESNRFQLSHKITLDPKTQMMKDAVSALINLGYSQLLAHNAIKLCMEEIENEDIEISSLITSALSRIK